MSIQTRKRAQFKTRALCVRPENRNDYVRALFLRPHSYSDLTLYVCSTEMCASTTDAGHQF